MIDADGVRDNTNGALYKTAEKDLKQNVKSFFKGVSDMFHKIGFYVVTLILIGVILGGFAMSWYQDGQMKNAALLGGMVYDNKVYNFTERVK